MQAPVLSAIQVARSARPSSALPRRPIRAGWQAEPVREALRGADRPRPGRSELLAQHGVTGLCTGDDDTFVSLGGDSLSYVEMSIALEEILGVLPRDWHTTPLREFVPARRGNPANLNCLTGQKPTTLAHHGTARAPPP